MEKALGGARGMMKFEKANQAGRISNGRHGLAEVEAEAPPPTAPSAPFWPEEKRPI